MFPVSMFYYKVIVFACVCVYMYVDGRMLSTIEIVSFGQSISLVILIWLLAINYPFEHSIHHDKQEAQMYSLLSH